MYMKFALKIGSFFGKVIVSYKMKIKALIKNLKFKKIKNHNSKIYLGISLKLNWPHTAHIAPEKFLDIFLLLSLLKLKKKFKVLYYSFNFHSNNLLLPHKKDSIFKANFIYVSYTFCDLKKYIVFLRISPLF